MQAYAHQYLVQQQHQIAVAQWRHQQQAQEQQQLQQLIQQEAEVWIAKEQQKRTKLPSGADGMTFSGSFSPLQSHKVFTIIV